MTNPNVPNVLAQQIDAALAGAEVKLVLAQSGLSLSGGNLVIWKSTVVVTDRGRQVFKGTPDYQQTLFDYLEARFPAAVVLRLDGSVQLPRGPVGARTDPLATIAQALALVNQELGRQIWKSVFTALLTLVLGLGILGLCIAYMINNKGDESGPAKGMILGITLGVAGIVLAIRSVLLYQRRNKVVTVIRGITEQGELPAVVLAGVLTPGATGSTGKSRVPSMRTVLCVLALVLMLCPGFGTVVALIGLALTYKRPSWARTSVRVMLVVNIILTVLWVVLLQFAPR